MRRRRLSSIARAPCRSVMGALGQRATAAPLAFGYHEATLRRVSNGLDGPMDTTHRCK
jgi:hypothetical protein